MKRKTGKKLLGVLLTLAMVIGLMPGMTLTAYAQPACPECGNYAGKTDPNTFYDFTWIDGTYMCMNPSHGDAGLTIPADQADRVPNDEDRWSTNQTITANKEIQDGVEVTADITLTINEGATLTVYRGINAKGHTLTVKGPGKLVVYGVAGKSGANGADGGVGAKIEDSDGGDGGGGNPGEAGVAGDAITGNLVVEGDATVEATGSDGGAGGNGGNGGTGGESVVKEASGFSYYGGNGGHGGIGGKGGDGGSGIVGNVTVKSGSLTATAGSAGAGGKGGDGGTGGYGSFGGEGGNGANGGNGGTGGNGITGTLTVTGGMATVTGGVGANGGAAGARGEGGEGFTPANHGDPGSPGQNAGTPGSLGSAVSGAITGKAQESDDNSAWTDISSGTTSTKRYVKVDPDSTHTHSFNYEASGATITATCTADGCTLSANPTLTINAPTMTAYGQTGDGISANATLTGLEDFNTATGKTIAATDITYVGREGTSYAESATAPTNAGKYTAKITLSGVKTSEGEGKSVTASVDYEIAKAATSVTTTPTAGEITYGQTLADSTLTGGAGSVAGTFAWKNTTIAPAVSDSETTEYDVVFTPTDGNYSTAECKVKLTVNKANPTNTVGQLSTFRGQTLADVTLPTAENGVWSWEDDTTTTLNELGMTTRFAKFTPNDTNNYNTLDNVSVQIQVSEKQPAVPATVTANNRTYDGTEKPLVTVDNSTLVGGELRYALGENATTAPAENLYTTSIPAKTDAGTYYVWYKVVGDATHSDSAAACVTVTINAAEYKTVSGDGQDHVIETGEDATFTVKRSTADENTFSRFSSIQVDGADVDASNYDKSEGSVIIKLKAAYLDTLSVGSHILKVLFTDGSVEIPFTVSKAAAADPVPAATQIPVANAAYSIPQTGDAADLALWAGALILGAVGLAMLKKRKHN